MGTAVIDHIQTYVKPRIKYQSSKKFLRCLDYIKYGYYLYINIPHLFSNAP